MSWKKPVKTGPVWIATTDKICLGLPDLTDEDPDVIVKKLVSDEIEGALIQDPDKVGEVATRVALKISKERESLKKLPDLEEIQEMAKECTQCGWCVRVCPNSLSMKELLRCHGR
jgi:acetyl-CoA decarbonylase/synthase alpha subunit (EC 1.2.99.2)